MELTALMQTWCYIKAEFAEINIKHIHIRMCPHTHTYVSMYAHTCVYTYIHTYIHIHVYADGGTSTHADMMQHQG